MIFSRIFLSLLGLVLVEPFTPVLAQSQSSGATQASPQLRQQFDHRSYTPAVVRFSFSNGEAADTTKTSDSDHLNITLIPPEGPPIGRRVAVTSSQLAELLRSFYSQLARQEPLNLERESAPARKLHDLLIGPIREHLQELGITTLLISADTGLQAVPFAALHDGDQYFGVRYALSLTPSLALTPIDQAPADTNHRTVALGASEFSDLAPLPLVPQELRQVVASRGAESYLNKAFTPEVLLRRASQDEITRVHVATHAEFQPGGPQKSKLYSGTTPLSLSRFSLLRKGRKQNPLDLFALSACRTALGDQDSELGFAGLALQAGARSAVGTLWYVDDVATSAFFLQFYRYLDLGYPKAEALQATRADFASGRVRPADDRIETSEGSPLLTGLTSSQRQRVSAGMRHPYFWGGVQLLGSPR